LLAATAAAFLATLSAAFISLAASLLATALLATSLFTATTLIFFTIVWHISPLIDLIYFVRCTYSEHRCSLP
jgi:hypothetical protein